ncbi:MAG: class I SAM-dependent methyltransferase, partial [Chloroflexota bacterium]
MSEFDALAVTYDSDFTSQPIGEILRARVHERLLTHFSVGDHVLEMGCGTGEDALFLSQQGINVTATDASDEMLAVARAKTAQTDTVKVQHLNLANLPPQHVSSFDGAFSNFGALNCLTNWRP